MINSVGSGSNAYEALGMMVQQGQDPVSQAASMGALKAALDSAQAESAALISQVSTAGSLDVYA